MLLLPLLHKVDNIVPKKRKDCGIGNTNKATQSLSILTWR